MVVKKVVVCDNCGEEIGSGKRNYDIQRIEKGGKVVFKSGRFTDGAGDRDNKTFSVDLCKSCCRTVVKTLKELKEGNYEDRT